MTPKAAIAGTGFIGRVHARSVRLAGGELVGVAASSPESAAAAATELGAQRRFDSAEELVRDPDIDVVHVCTPNHLHQPLAEAALAAGKHVICEKPLALDAAGAKRSWTPRPTRGGRRRCRSSTATTRRSAKRASASAADGPGAAPAARHLSPGLAAATGRHELAGGRGAGRRSRAFADIGSHWCDLAEFVTGHRITRLSGAPADRGAGPRQRAGPARVRPGRRAASSRPVTTEDAALVQFETDAGALGSVVVSQVSAGRKNRLWIELDGSDEALAFDQEHPEELWCGSRE